MNTRRRAIRQAVRSSLYWSMMWRVAEANVHAGGLPPDFDRGKLLWAIDTMRGRRGPLWEAVNAPESILSPVTPFAGTTTPKKQNRPLAGPS